MLKGCIYLFHFEKASPPDFRSVPLTCHLTIFLGGSKSAVWKCVFESISLSLEPPPAGLWRGGTVVGVKEWRQRCHRVPFLIFFILLIFLTFFYVFKFFWLFSFLFKKKTCGAGRHLTPPRLTPPQPAGSPPRSTVAVPVTNLSKIFSLAIFLIFLRLLHFQPKLFFFLPSPPKWLQMFFLEKKKALPMKTGSHFCKDTTKGCPTLKLYVLVPEGWQWQTILWMIFFGILQKFAIWKFYQKTFRTIC